MIPRPPRSTLFPYTTLFRSLGITVQLKEFTKYIVPSTLDVVTVKGKQYGVYKYEGKVSNVENSLVLICYEVDGDKFKPPRSEEHTSELQSRQYLVCRLLLEKKKNI